MVRWAKQCRPSTHLHHAALHQVGGAEVLDALTAQLDAALGDLAALGLEQVGDGAQGGGLAGTVAPEHGGDLALGHVERDALEHKADVVVDDLYAADVENDVGGAHEMFLDDHSRDAARRSCG